jgi:hypothetical protein
MIIDSEGASAEENYLADNCLIGVRLESDEVTARANIVLRTRFASYMDEQWLSTGIDAYIAGMSGPIWGYNQGSAVIEDNVVVGVGATSIPDLETGQVFAASAISAHGSDATIRRNRISHQPFSGIGLFPEISTITMNCPPSLATTGTIEGNIIETTAGVGIGLWGFLGISGCEPSATVTANTMAGVQPLNLPFREDEVSYVNIGYCAGVVDGASADMRDNTCIGPGMLGILFSDASAGSMTGNEIRGAPVAGSIDGSNTELVSLGANTFECNGLDAFQENGGWAKPPMPSVSMPP